MKLRQWDEAKQKYDRAIVINPNDGKAYFNPSIVLANMGHQARATIDLERAKQILLETGDLENYRQVEQRLQQQPTLVPRWAR